MVLTQTANSHYWGFPEGNQYWELVILLLSRMELISFSFVNARNSNLFETSYSGTPLSLFGALSS